MRTNIIDSMLYMVRRHILLVQGVALLAVSLFIALQVVAPIITKTYEINSTITAKKTKLDELSKQVAFLTNLDPVILGQRVETLDRVLPKNKDVLLYLSTIDGLSRELSLQLSGIKLSPGEVATGAASKTASAPQDAVLKTLDTELSISGNQELIYSFLRRIEQTAPLMRVGDVKISLAPDGTASLKLMLSMMYAEPTLSSKFSGKTLLFDTAEEEMYKQITGLQTYHEITTQGLGQVPVGKTNLFESIKAQQ